MNSNIDYEHYPDLVPITGESGYRLPDPDYWHAIAGLSDGTRIGQLGAFWYILDQDNRAVSDGYHTLYCDESGDYKGQRGSRTEEVALYAEPHRAPTNARRLSLRSNHNHQ